MKKKLKVFVQTGMDSVTKKLTTYVTVETQGAPIEYKQTFKRSVPKSKKTTRYMMKEMLAPVIKKYPNYELDIKADAITMRMLDGVRS